MIVRDFKFEQDYPEVSKWWVSQNWPALPKPVLSSSGFIVEDGDVKIAASWVLPTDTCIYLMEWTVGNPNVSWEKRDEALVMLTDKCCEYAKSEGATSLMTMTKNKRYIEKLKNNKFIESDKDMVHLLRSL